MIDIHPPQHAAMTKREFFVHLFIVVLGILIAIGLEQAVEYFHHRHQVADTRAAIRRETAQNIRRFALETEEFNRFAPRLLTDAAILRFLRDHPHAPPQQWPGHFDLFGFYMGYDLSAWTTAQQSGVLVYMPRDEVARDSAIYKSLELLNQLEISYREAIYQVRTVFISQPDAAKFTPSELVTVNDRMAQLMVREAICANTQRNISGRIPEFSPVPTQQEVDRLLNISLDPQSTLEVQQFIRRLEEIADGPE